MNPLIYRKIFSPIWQKFKNQKIYSYLDLFEKNENLQRTEIERTSFKDLKKLLVFCQDNVPYYRRLFSEMNINTSNINNFEDYRAIPILTKEVFRKNYKDFIPEKKIKFGYTETSGSTGAPTRFMISKVATEKWYAAKLYGRMLHGIKPGDPILWIWGRKFKTQTRLYNFLKNNLENEYKFSAFDINRKKALELYNLIRRKKIKSIYGYSSAIYEYAKILKNNGLTINLKTVFVTAEGILDYQKEIIQSVFKCPVVKEYGAAEMGILTFDCKEGKSHIIEENVYLELSNNESDNSLNEIIITDLNNYAMPLLRYNSGDLSSGFDAEFCKCGSSRKILKDVIGRKYDVIKLSNGKMIHGEMINYVLKHTLLDEFPDGCLFEFKQESYHSFKLILALFNLDDNTKTRLNKKIQESFTEALGTNYNFNLVIIYDKQIRRLDSGKHRYILSEVR